MSHTKLCASCKNGAITSQTTIDTDDTQLPRWLRECDYVQRFIDNSNSFRQKHPTNATMEVAIKVSPKLAGRSVLFWATKPSLGVFRVPDARNAYGDFSNSGVSYVKKDGSVIFKVRCPQIYSVIPFGRQKRAVFPRHIHWIISNEKKTNWVAPVMTTNILCNSSKDIVENAIRTQSAFVVNALSQKYHDKLSIPGTSSLGHERLNTMTYGRICGEVMRKMIHQVPDLVRKLKQSNVDHSNAPIILYCAHKECKAAVRLANILMKAGFTNLYYYKGGLLDWYDADTLREAFA